ncbi:MAG TPA: 2-succinyl-5-enolpyruvyl-6-hydroxy-3-cyclohexene-1-carboxylic-acid synthase, partial [Acidimicrobiales bacterium]
EADLAGVPLIACTADRPPELRDVGAPQAIDQLHLFGRSPRWFADAGVPDAATTDRWRPLAARLVAEATGDRPGPVHLNLPFREPLVGTPGTLPAARPSGPWAARVPAAATGDPPPALSPVRPGVIVAGPAGVDGAAVHRLAATLGWPVLADPRSAAWGMGGSSAGTCVVPHADAIVRARSAGVLRPEVILRLGPPPASRALNEWLAGSGAEEVVVGAPGWSDPAGTATTVVAGLPGTVAAWARALSPQGAPPAEPPATREGWLGRWRDASAAAAEAVREALAGCDGPNEPSVARDLTAALGDGSWLVVSSSMPVRDVERYAAPRPGLRIVGNRGANGIDGVVSAAVGIALGSGSPTALLAGDLAFLHDTNGLLRAADRGIDLVCVVVDNDGGGIFSFLPQARALPPERFEALFGTPHGLDLVRVAGAHGVATRAVGGSELPEAVSGAAADGGVAVLVVRTDRAANVAVHRQVDEAVAAAVDRVLGGLGGAGG